MGWFDDQIEFRKKHEREFLSDSFENIARSITGRKIRSSISDQEDVNDAVSALLKHMGVKEREVPAGIRGLRDRLDYLLSSTGILYREIILSKGWQADAMGPMIASLKETGAVVALLPSEMGGYEYTDPATSLRVRVTAQTAKNVNEEALCFYRPLPMRELKLKDLLRYMMSCLTTRDIASFGVAALAITLVGLLMPKLNHILTGTVVETGSMQLLCAVVSFLFFATVASVLLTIIRSMLLSRIRFKLNVNDDAHPLAPGLLLQGLLRR